MFTSWDGDYEKVEYEVKLKSGEVVVCWPNAGRMNALDGSGREFYPKDVDGIRELKDEK